MIDKRISYRFGGGYQGRDTSPSKGPAGGASSGGNYGGNTGGNQSGGRGGGGGGGDAREQYIAQQYTAPAPASVYKDPDPVTETVPGDTEPKPEKYTGPKITPHRDTGEEKEPYEMVKGVEVPLSMRGVKGVDPREDPERYFEDPTKKSIDDVMAKDESDYTIEDKEIIEDYERAQDWDLIKDMSKKGYDFNEIQSAIEKGLTLKAPTTDTRRQGLIDYGLSTLKNLVPKTGLERSLLSRMKSFAPGAQTGISSLTDKMGGLGKFFNPVSMIRSFLFNKMGLGFLNPILGIASLFGGFNPFSNIGSRYALPYKKQPIPTERDGQQKTQNVMKASIKKFQPTDQQTAQINEIMRKRMILQGYADKGSLNERGMNTLTQMNQLINQYQVDPGSIYG